MKKYIRPTMDVMSVAKEDILTMSNLIIEKVGTIVFFDKGTLVAPGYEDIDM